MSAKELSEKILHIIEKTTVLQSDLVQKLGVRDQRIADAVKFLLSENKISRTRSGKTYLIDCIRKKPVYIATALLSGMMFSPCTACVDTCDPTSCIKLSVWVGISVEA
jgi:hypothetical protein